MKKFILRIIRYFFRKYLSEEDVSDFILKLAHNKRLDLLRIVYNSIGILKSSRELTGEINLINNIIPSILGDSGDLIFFDVGANIGNYSLELRNRFEKATIFAFEPVKKTFDILHQNTKNKEIHCLNIGIGKEEYETNIFVPTDLTLSSHASAFEDVLTGFHNYDNYETEIIKIDSINNFCKEKNITKIDFLKIDTEGFEFDVLIGATDFLDQIKLIQFEFNETNIISRVFLRDFYKRLSNFDFYRIDSEKLIPLYEYKSKYEIFQFQNVLAVNKIIDYKY